MSATFTEYYVQLINYRTKKPIDDDTGKYAVMVVDTPAPEVIYSDDKGTPSILAVTGIAQTMTDGIMQFWTISSVTSVDLTIVTANGESVFVKGLTPDQHRVEVNEETIDQLMVVPFNTTVSGVTATGSIVSNGFSVPGPSLVHDCYLRTSTLGTTALLDVGLSGDPNGYLVGCTCSVTGFQYPEELLVSVTAVLSRGLLLQATGVTSGFMRRSAIYTTATGIVYQNACVTTLAAMNGWIYIKYEKLPV